MKAKVGKSVTFEAVRRLGLTLPDVEATTYYGGLALKVRGKVFACEATNKAAEPNTLVVWTDEAARDELIAAQPDVYYLKDHYVGDTPVVLVRLSRVDKAALQDLLIGARRLVLASASKRVSPPSAAPRQRRVRRHARPS